MLLRSNCYLLLFVVALHQVQVTAQSNRVPDPVAVTLEGNLLVWTPTDTPGDDDGTEITQYLVLISAPSMDPVEVVVLPQQTQFDLSDPQLLVAIRVIYSIVVFAKNTFGMGPPSNAIFYRRLDGTEAMPALYRFFQTSAIQPVNGSSLTANCQDVTPFFGTFICNSPTSSVLYDGQIPTLVGLDGDMWAEELLTIQPQQPGINALVAFDFVGVEGYTGVTSVEVVMFNCPEWGISVQSISLLEARDISVAGTTIATILVSVTSCDSLVRICIPQSTLQPAAGLLFSVSPGSDWVHIAEITFYSSGGSCPPDIVISAETAVQTDTTPTSTMQGGLPGAPTVSVDVNVLRWTVPAENTITQYRVDFRCVSLKKNTISQSLVFEKDLYISATTGGSPIEISVMPDQTRFDLNDPRLVSQDEYQVVVLAENSFGLGPPSNVVTYTRVEEVVVAPLSYQFFLTAPIQTVNGSSITANCPDFTPNSGGTFTCLTPQESILYDGDIPTLTGLDGDMWANQLLTLQPSRPGITTLVAFNFKGLPDYSGVTRVEVAIFNCPEWGISVQSVSLLEASDITLAGTNIATVTPTITSCDSLVRVCIARASFQPALGVEFLISPGSDWVHIAEITFYNEGRTCPPDIVVTEPAIPASSSPGDGTVAAEQAPTLTDSANATEETKNNRMVIIASSVSGGVVIVLLAAATVLTSSLLCTMRLRKAKIQRREHCDMSDVDMPQYTVRSSFLHDIPKSLVISSNNLQIGKSIGQGEHGIVYKGTIKSVYAGIPSETVAIKTLKGFVEKELVTNLLKECGMMHLLEHPNVLKLRGVCLDGGPAPYVVMPFMANGSLLSYLRDHQEALVMESSADNNTESVQKKLMDMCIQVSKGMRHLAEKNIVHRDLAARNCMIDINFVIKVADFGLSEKYINTTKQYFRQGQESSIKLPVKWLAPESIYNGVFSEKSDMWSYGVTCWEIFSGGKTPYAGIPPADLPSRLETGFRMKKPLNAACTKDMYGVMQDCWEARAEDRPTFEDIVERLTSQLVILSDYLDFSASTTPSIPLNEETNLVT